jgi:hypothetical protein
MPTDFTIWGPIERDDLPGLCDRVCALLHARGPGEACCDVADVEPDASQELRDVIAFMGLQDVLVD